MVKRVTVLLLALIMVVPLVLTVRGGGKDNPPVVNGVTLSRSITNNTSGITVRYPNGWVAKQDAGSIVIASSEDVLSGKPEAGDITFTVLPLPLQSPQTTDLDTAFTVMANFLTANPEATTGSQPVATVVAGQPARRMTIVDSSQGDTLILGWLSGDQMIVAMSMTPVGGMARMEPLALAMAETIRVRQ